ncbi:DNA mismatch repair protein [Moelleriella libera RCEF 2490]|uniref:DNA mismatch repair protein PMS1 n=1 Tax=Moelleriella libera RCEF 2490 TaxID=1081109 RepID=A0A162IME7_9HYPO|nr:DNA mismatch repair protein [Moelleriella libera RCEF 2490]
MATTIRPIDGRSIHLIQSGQVIVDLCSVAKELVENSIDAGASIIDVRFRNQGLEAIDVQDNGSGIPSANYKAIARKHHTSKLSTYSDIASLQTYGFRGEALASLSAVSTLTITTCVESDIPKGSRLSFDARGNLSNVAVTAAQRGTTVVVENLFHNLPVRRRELERNIKREWLKVIALLNQYACIQTNLKFSVSQQPSKGKRVLLFSTKGNPTTRENIVNIFGSKACTTLIALELDMKLQVAEKAQQVSLESSTDPLSRNVHISGHISRPVHGDGRQAPDRQMLFVNGRPCGLPQFAKIFNEVYKSYNLTQSPFIFANIQLDTELYDVNVSPDKRSILLHDQGALLEDLRASLTALFDKQNYQMPSSGPSVMKSMELKERSPELNKYYRVLDDTPRTPSADGIRTNTSSNSEDIQCPRGQYAEVPRGRRSPSKCGSKEARLSAAIRGKQLALNDWVSYDTRSSSSRSSDPQASTNDQSQANSSLTSSHSSGTGARLVSLVHQGDKRRDETAGTLPQNAGCESQKPQVKHSDGFIASLEQGVDKTARSLSDGSLEGESISSLRDASISPTQSISAAARSYSDRDNSESSDNLDRAFDHAKSGRLHDSHGRKTHGFRRSDNDQRDSPEIVHHKFDTKKHDFISVQRRGAEGRREALLDQITIDLPAVTTFSHAIKKKWSTAQDVQTIQTNLDIIAGTKCYINYSSKHFSGIAQKQVEDIDAPDAESRLSTIITKEHFAKMKVVGQFNKGFVIAIRPVQADARVPTLAHSDEVLIVDQHASDEIFNFERLQSKTIVQSQHLVRSMILSLTALEEEIVSQNLGVLKSNGFKVDIDLSGDAAVGSRCRLLALPLSREITFTLEDLEELIAIMADQPAGSEHIPRPSRVRKMFAMRACRGSIMIGKALTLNQMYTLLRHMGEIDKPWNCPHGRPTMRHLCRLQLLDEARWADDLPGAPTRISWLSYSATS